MKKILKVILGALSLGIIALLWLGNENSMEPLDGCKDNEELKVYCNFMNPEDLALTPDGNFLIVAEFGGMAPLVEMTSGELSFFNIKDKIKSKARLVLEKMNGAPEIAPEIRPFPLVLMVLIWFKERMESFNLQWLVTIPMKA